ncbi:EthD family reductase [Actinoplanes sp. L3-i22]|uniref:EthD family reductase n=1 Tax=Actinoplanes sp. L3-i22 TaxID=2836373 RepID=UPI001C74310C|nr:EthD family reductase [Actinoplanes sp. L3-i22]BCY08954.1 ethyl tert-butyl ether degradation protein EthD [Actinoplanes sp. L3-i22]
MPTKITLVIDNPADAEQFEKVYAEIKAAAAKFPNLRRLESAKVWPKEDGTATPAYRTLDLYFDSYEDASAAVATPVAGEVFGPLLGSQVPFKGLFSDIEA